MAGYLQEAVIPGFFNGVTDGLFIAKFLSAQRQKTEESTWAPSQKHRYHPAAKDQYGNSADENMWS